MAEPAFFTLHQGDGKQAGQGQVRQSQQPPPPPMPNLRPPAQQQARPQNNQGNHNMTNQMNNQVNNANTFAHRGPVMPPTSQICDVSQEIMTEADKREDLTTFSAFRWEKIPEKSHHGIRGAKKSRWERAIRTEVKTMSQRDIVKEIRHLNRSTKTFVDKRKDLDLALQRQIDKVQEELMFNDPGRAHFDWCVVQMDHQLREIPLHHATSSSRHNVDTAYLDLSANARSSQRRSKSRVDRLYHRNQNTRQAYDAHQQSKKRFERLALTVYFKREPKPTANVEWLYNAQRQQTGNMNSWGQPQNFITGNNQPQQQQQQQQHQQQQQQQQQNQRWDANQGRPQGQQQNGQQFQNQKQQQHKQPQKQMPHGVQVVGKPAARNMMRQDSGSDSDSGSWSSGSSDSSFTAPSSQGRPPKLPIGPRGPQMTGARPIVMAPGHNMGRPIQIPVPRPQVHQNMPQHHVQAQPQVHSQQFPVHDTAVLDQIRDEAYRKGREHEKIVNDELNRRQRLDTRPIPIQRSNTPQGVRHVRYADTRDDLRNRRLAEYVNDYSGEESDDYGMSDLSIADQSDRAGGRRYRRDSYGYEYTSSPTRTQSSVFSEDPFVPRRAAYQGVARGPGGHQFIETGRGGGHGTQYRDGHNPFHPRPRSPRFYSSSGAYL